MKCEKKNSNMGPWLTFNWHSLDFRKRELLEVVVEHCRTEETVTVAWANSTGTASSLAGVRFYMADIMLPFAKCIRAENKKNKAQG